jgi:CheY-like chemotaxis protein
MDLQMPNMDGLEATAKIRELPGYQETPILALTANCSDEIRLQCQKHGLQGFLSKPIGAAALWTAASRWLQISA